MLTASAIFSRKDEAIKAVTSYCKNKLSSRDSQKEEPFRVSPYPHV